MSSKIVLSVLCLAGHPESVFPYTVVLYYGGPPKLVPGGACQGGLKVASVAPILASGPGLGGPSRGPRGAPQEQIWCRNRVLRANLVPKSCFESKFSASGAILEGPRGPGWTPGSWGRTPGGGLLAGPLDPGRTPGFLAGPLDSWLDPWIPGWTPGFLAGPLDSGWIPGFRQISEFLADFGAGGQILVLEVTFGTSCAYRIILGIIYPLEMLFLRVLSVRCTI